MDEHFRPPVQCSDDVTDPEPSSFQTGQAVPVPQVSGAAGGSNLSARDLEGDAERVDQSARPRERNEAASAVPRQSGDRIEITGKHGQIIATGVAGAMKPGTIFQLGAENKMNVYKGDQRSGSDREGRKANIKNRRPLTTSQEAPQPRHLDGVSVGLAGDWRRLGRAFGITDPQLDQIHMDYRMEGQHEVNYRVLLTWKQKSDRPTLATLAQILLDIGRGDLADELAKG